MTLLIVSFDPILFSTDSVSSFSANIWCISVYLLPVGYNVDRVASPRKICYYSKRFDFKETTAALNIGFKIKDYLYFCGVKHYIRLAQSTGIFLNI